MIKTPLNEKTPLKKKSSKKTAMGIRFSVFMFIFAML